jgi:hypothetical protein
VVNSTLRLSGNKVCPCNGPKYLNPRLTNVHPAHSLSDKCTSSSNIDSFKFSSNVAIYYQNIQGLRCKTDELLNFLDPNLPIFCVYLRITWINLSWV